MKKRDDLSDLEDKVRELQAELAAQNQANIELNRQNEYFKKVFTQQEEASKQVQQVVVLPPEALKTATQASLQRSVSTVIMTTPLIAVAAGQSTH
jgi:hypothetical protein